MSVIIRLQRLSWSANAADIRSFFSSCEIPEGGVHIVGGKDGDAFIAFATDEDARKAMHLDGGSIKNVPIKLLLSSRKEMQGVIEKARQEYAATSQPTPPTRKRSRSRSRSPPSSRRRRSRSPVSHNQSSTQVAAAAASTYSPSSNYRIPTPSGGGGAQNHSTGGIGGGYHAQSRPTYQSRPQEDFQKYAQTNPPNAGNAAAPANSGGGLPSSIWATQPPSHLLEAHSGPPIQNSQNPNSVSANNWNRDDRHMTMPNRPSQSQSIGYQATMGNESSNYSGSGNFPANQRSNENFQPDRFGNQSTMMMNQGVNKPFQSMRNQDNFGPPNNRGNGNFQPNSSSQGSQMGSNSYSQIRDGDHDHNRMGGGEMDRKRPDVGTSQSWDGGQRNDRKTALLPLPPPQPSGTQDHQESSPSKEGSFKAFPKKESQKAAFPPPKDAGPPTGFQRPPFTKGLGPRPLRPPGLMDEMVGGGPRIMGPPVPPPVPPPPPGLRVDENRLTPKLCLDARRSGLL